MGTVSGKVLGGIVAGLVVTGGAATASAAAGGPNVAEAVHQLVASQQNSQGQSQTATGTPAAEGKPEDAGFLGLCNAWDRGSDNGQQHKRESKGFEKLVTAAGGVDQVTAYCATLSPEASSTATSNEANSSNANSNSASNPSGDAQGGKPESPGKSEGDHGRPDSAGAARTPHATATATATATPNP
ncbi:MAG: hypothetical protein WC273_11320 [Dehalococcoidia bacterium]